MPTQKATLAALLHRHGRTYAREAGIRLRDTPAPLFELLVLTSLLSVNTSSRIGVRAAAAMVKAYPTAAKLDAADDDARWQVLADARSLRKRQHARQLGDLARLAQERYRGDLRRMRDAADGDRSRLRALLEEFTGIGDVGADIYCREAQAVWPVLRPWTDDRMLAASGPLHLPDDGAGLARLAGTDDLSSLGAALVRCHLEGDAEEVLAAAG